MIPALYDGIPKNNTKPRAANVIAGIPNSKSVSKTINAPVTTMNYKSTNKLSNVNFFTGTVHQPNSGGIRGVLPCKGITPTGIVGGIIRPPAVPQEGGTHVPSGIARSQPKGLAYLKAQPTNLPILPSASSINGALNCKFKQPNSLTFK